MLHVNFSRDPKYSWVHEQKKIEFIFYIYIFIINIQNIKTIFDLGIKTVLCLKYNRFNGFVWV